MTIGQSQESALNNLLANGLTSNPDIVNQVNHYVEEKWAEAKDAWLCAERDETNELQRMKESNIVKTIVDYRFAIHSAFKQNQNWFTLLNSRKGLLLFNIISEHKAFFFEDLIEHLIDIFGPSLNTMKLCKYVLDKAGAKLKDDTEIILNNYVDKGYFEPIDE